MFLFGMMDNWNTGKHESFSNTPFLPDKSLVIKKAGGIPVFHCSFQIKTSITLTTILYNIAIEFYIYLGIIVL